MVEKKRLVNKKAFRNNPVDYSAKELAEFYTATYKAYTSVIADKPNALIAPLRGAEPLTKAIRLYANSEKKSNLLPMFYYPRVGEFNYGVSGKILKKNHYYSPKALEASEQKKEISRMLDRLIKRTVGRRKDKKIKITVIDEVKQGGSVSQFVNFLNEEFAKRGMLKNVEINIIAIAQKNPNRSKGYLDLKKKYRVKELSVKRLFTMDSKRYLISLLKETNFYKGNKKTGLALTRKSLLGREKLLEDLLLLHRKKNPSKYLPFVKNNSRKKKKIPKRINKLGRK